MRPSIEGWPFGAQPAFCLRNLAEGCPSREERQEASDTKESNPFALEGKSIGPVQSANKSSLLSRKEIAESLDVSTGKKSADESEKMPKSSDNETPRMAGKKTMMAKMKCIIMTESDEIK